jgi:predicted SprT family Zn-dependent metalloprotease
LDCTIQNTPRVVLNTTPTGELYDELQQAFDHFNRTLFEGRLPPAVLTLQRDRTCYGYFAGSRFVRRSGERADEIAMNPAYFAAQPIASVLSTLVHEMCHLWQFHYGKPGRRGYHNTQWAVQMWVIGLVPSHNGAPGGRRTGEKMDHYIREGGAFARSCAALLAQPFTLHWLDRVAALSQAVPETNLPPELIALGIEPARQQRAGNRVKYRCGTCRMQVWGKPDLSLLCGTCDGRPLEPVQKDLHAS